MPATAAWSAPDWFDRTFLGLEVRQYLGVAALIVAATVVYLAIIRIIRIVVRHRYVGDELAFWDRERRRLHTPLLVLTAGVTFLVGVPALDFSPDVEKVLDQVFSLVSAVATILVAYRAIDVLMDVFNRRARKTDTQLDDSLVPLLRTSLRLFATIVGLLFVLGNLGINVSSLIAALGLGGLAIALAAQDTIRHLIGGATIFADKPFEVGDWVVAGDIEGTVEAVGFRSTRVRTFYNSLVSVPNGKLIDSGIDNMGQRRWRRYRTTLGVGYHTTPDQIQAFVEGIRAIIQANPGMRQDYYIVEFHGFGATSLDILVYCFIEAPDWNEELRIRHVFNLDIMRLARELQVEFAFPTQTVHIAALPGQPPQTPEVPDRDQLREVVESFGPGGDSGQRVDQPLTSGHDSTPSQP